MKKIILILIFPLISFSQLPESWSGSNKGPEIKFIENVLNLGDVNEGEIVSAIFEYSNIGSEPLIIKNIKGSCGCTVPEWSEEPTKVGGSGKVIVKFNSSNRKGRQNKTITVMTNSIEEVIKLRIQANVIKN